MILITTAGKVGAEAARLLAAHGEPVRVLSRHDAARDFIGSYRTWIEPLIADADG
jgi:uncharacterized protein YbjT (DUF2867 family)